MAQGLGNGGRKIFLAAERTCSRVIRLRWGGREQEDRSCGGQEYSKQVNCKCSGASKSAFGLQAKGDSTAVGIS